jgi:tetratricopeptide (TPR) repeat protein
MKSFTATLLCGLAAFSLGAVCAQNPAPQQTGQFPAKQRCDALKASLLKDAYDWHIYSQIGDALMEMNHPREAASAYERAIAVYPLSKERGNEMRQAEFIAAQAKAEETRQRISREAAEKQAQAQSMASTMEMFSMLPGASTAGALRAQQGLAAAATMTQGMAQADAMSASAQAAGIANPIQQISFTLPERQETASLWIKLGKAYEGYGEHDRAGSAFEQGYSMDPARFDALYLTGLCLHSSGQRQKAIVAASRYLSLSPADAPPICQLLGDSLRASGMEKDALSAYSAALKTLAGAAAAKPQEIQPLLSLGVAQIKGGDYSAALDSFKKAAPSSSMALCGIIICQISLGDQAGLRETANLLRGKAVTPEEWYALARANDVLADDDAAAVCYSKCASLWDAANPSQENQPGFVAFARDGTGRHDASIELLKERLSKEPFAQDSFLDLHRLGLSYLKAKEPRPDFAAETFRQCLEENPSFAQAAIELKKLSAKNASLVEALLADSDKSSDKQAALIFRSKAWALMPDGPQREQTLQEISSIAKSLGQPQMPDEASILWLKANCILSSKRSMADIKNAVREFRQAYVLAPWSQALMVNLATCHSALNRNDLAKADIETAMRLPDGRTQENLSRKFEYDILQTRSVKEIRELTPFK